MKTRIAMSSIESPDVQILILARVKRMVAPMCGVLPSANMRDRARRIYNIAKELEDDIRKANNEGS